MQQPHFEPSKGVTHRTDAKNEFVRRVYSHLPARAIEEFSLLPSARAVGEWAKRWRVNAPCVVKDATSRWAQVRSRGGARLTGWHWEGADPSLVEKWRDELRALNALPVDTVGLENPVALFTREWIRTGRAEAFEASGVLTPKKEMKDAGLDYCDRVLANPSVRAPIAADPLRESLTDFLERARCHWDARAACASKRGFTATSPRPSLLQHADWLARYQVCGESYRAIARTARRDIQAVREAVSKTAALVSIRLRRPDKGGRPKRKP
jgi:hypothetical protein